MTMFSCASRKEAVDALKEQYGDRIVMTNVMENGAIIEGVIQGKYLNYKMFVNPRTGRVTTVVYRYCPIGYYVIISK